MSKWAGPAERTDVERPADATTTRIAEIRAAVDDGDLREWEHKDLRATVKWLLDKLETARAEITICQYHTEAASAGTERASATPPNESAGAIHATSGGATVQLSAKDWQRMNVAAADHEALRGALERLHEFDLMSWREYRTKYPDAVEFVDDEFTRLLGIARAALSGASSRPPRVK